MIKLVQEAKKHNKEAFTELIYMHETTMYKVAKAILLNDEDAADAIQDTIVICWEKITTLKNNHLFKTWLTRILINNCYSILNKRTDFADENVLMNISEVNSSYNDIEWQSVLKQLPEKYRTVIILYYVDGFKVREIAKILETKESNIKYWLASARNELKNLI